MTRKNIVVARTPGVMDSGIQTSKGKLKFGNKTARWVSDDVADEIDKTYGLKGTGDVWIERDENLNWHNHHDGNTDGRNTGVHHYTFGAMTSPEANEFWKRYEKKKKALEKEKAKAERENEWN